MQIDQEASSNTMTLCLTLRCMSSASERALSMSDHSSMCQDNGTQVVGSQWVIEPSRGHQVGMWGEGK